MADGRIGIIGKGNVGSALKEGLSGAGYEVRTTGKDIEEVRDVASWAECIVLAVPFGERENAFKEMGDGWKGKTIVDVTNALSGDQQYSGSLQESGAEWLQSRFTEARFVKAFNTVFAQNMPKGRANGEPLSLLVAGDDLRAKEQVLEWGQRLGFDPVDVGPLHNARWLETLGYLNIQLGYALDNGTDSGWRYVHPGVRTASDREQTAQIR